MVRRVVSCIVLLEVSTGVGTENVVAVEEGGVM